MSDATTPQPTEEDRRWAYIVALDDELMLGGYTMSEHAVELMRNADVCYVNGAFVAGMITAAAAIETWLRTEPGGDGKATFAELLKASALRPEVAQDAHSLRKARNAWVHVDADDDDDQRLLAEFDQGHPALEEKCRLALRTMRQVVYSCPWV